MLLLLFQLLRTARNLIFLAILEAPAAFILFGAGAVLVGINIFLWFLGHVAVFIATLVKLHNGAKLLAAQWHLSVVAWIYTKGMKHVFGDLGIHVQVPDLDLAKFGLPNFELPKLDLPHVELPQINLPSLDIPRLEIPRVPPPTPHVEIPNPMEASQLIEDARNAVEARFGEVKDILENAQRKRSVPQMSIPSLPSPPVVDVLEHAELPKSPPRFHPPDTIPEPPKVEGPNEVINAFNPPDIANLERRLTRLESLTSASPFRPVSTFHSSK